jgi:hypothetical protein
MSTASVMQAGPSLAHDRKHRQGHHRRPREKAHRTHLTADRLTQSPIVHVETDSTALTDTVVSRRILS